MSDQKVDPLEYVRRMAALRDIDPVLNDDMHMKELRPPHAFVKPISKRLLRSALFPTSFGNNPFIELSQSLGMLVSDRMAPRNFLRLFAKRAVSYHGIPWSKLKLLASLLTDYLMFVVSRRLKLVSSAECDDLLQRRRTLMVSLLRVVPGAVRYYPVLLKRCKVRWRKLREDNPKLPKLDDSTDRGGQDDKTKRLVMQITRGKNSVGGMLSILSSNNNNNNSGGSDVSSTKNSSSSELNFSAISDVGSSVVLAGSDRGKTGESVDMKVASDGSECKRSEPLGPDFPWFTEASSDPEIRDVLEMESGETLEDMRCCLMRAVRVATLVILDRAVLRKSKELRARGDKDVLNHLDEHLYVDVDKFLTRLSDVTELVEEWALNA